MNIHAPAAAANVRPKPEVYVNKQANTRQAAERLVEYKQNIQHSHIYNTDTQVYSERPLNGPADPPSSQISTCGPWSEKNKARVFSSMCSSLTTSRTSPTAHDISLTWSPYTPAAQSQTDNHRMIKFKNPAAWTENSPPHIIIIIIIMKTSKAPLMGAQRRRSVHACK